MYTIRNGDKFGVVCRLGAQGEVAGDMPSQQVGAQMLFSRQQAKGHAFQGGARVGVRVSLEQKPRDGVCGYPRRG